MPLPDCHWLANEEEEDNVSKAHIHIHSRAPSNDLIVERGIEEKELADVHLADLPNSRKSSGEKRALMH